MTTDHPAKTRSLNDCIEFIRKRIGTHWIVGAPLGLGKPNHILNALYDEAKKHPDVRLDLFTALSLNPPKPATGLKQRFLQPFVKRHFGDYPRLTYLQDLDNRSVPPNITISEFYFRSGSQLRNSSAQENYVSSNYTHVARDMQARGVNLLLQMVACHPDKPGFLSLSCNPDVTLDLLQNVPREKLLFIAQLNPDLPYMDGDAELPESAFDMIVEDYHQPLFAVPRMPVNDQDNLIGLHCSRMIRDGGTLQLGIGSLGDAVSFFTVLRHQHNPAYRKLIEEAETEIRAPAGLLNDWGGDEPFDQGLYAASEMFMEGFLHLYRAGVLKRKVFDHAGLQDLLNQGLLSDPLPRDAIRILYQNQIVPRHLDRSTLAWLVRFGIVNQELRCEDDTLSINANERVTNDLQNPSTLEWLQKVTGKALRGGKLMHAAFFLGSQWMYDTLNEMSDEERSLFQMTGVSRINQLYRGEDLDRAQRLEGRFINTTMKLTLLGSVASDQLEDGQVVSGVGGQYNFVAMAHALDRSRSILMLRSYRETSNGPVSNIVWEFPHATIPRHLRDVVATEYGLADLRSANDQEVIQRILCICDSRWQESLRRKAVAAGKLDPDWSVPEPFTRNSPAWVKQVIGRGRLNGVIHRYPFGSDFTETEQELTRALAHLQQANKTRIGQLKLLVRALAVGANQNDLQRNYMVRMGLENPTSLADRIDRRLLQVAIKSTALHQSNN